MERSLRRQDVYRQPQVDVSIHLDDQSKIFSVSIDPEIVVRELTLDIPGLESQTTKQLVDYDDFLLCCMDKVAVVWNLWLNQTRMIKSQPGLKCFGIGYDSNKRVKGKCYKTIARCQKDNHRCWTILNFDTDVWTCKPKSRDGNQERKHAYFNSRRGVSLNGNMYWVAFYDRTTGPLYHLRVYDFSSRKFSKFCDLPCEKNHPLDALSLGVFKGDRFSLLKQCHVTKKIEIWVTKNKINNDDNVVWMTFMEVSIPNLQDLVRTRSNSKPSYFIDDKRLVVCSCDEIGQAWIYVVVGKKLINKIQIDSVVGRWPLHCTYFPSLVPVPRRQREEAE